ncbi:MAG: hypothetical protein GXC72_10980, partial [Chitinophagaceae bacterium]|nr:hypothetical protein [Chitinophagaceae bacterium]
GFDHLIVTGNITYKHLSLIPFGLGVLFLAFYYLIWRPRHREEFETM